MKRKKILLVIMVVLFLGIFFITRSFSVPSQRKTVQSTGAQKKVLKLKPVKQSPIHGYCTWSSTRRAVTNSYNVDRVEVRAKGKFVVYWKTRHDGHATQIVSAAYHIRGLAIANIWSSSNSSCGVLIQDTKGQYVDTTWHLVVYK
jgi:hypothetical protein